MLTLVGMGGRAGGTAEGGMARAAQGTGPRGPSRAREPLALAWSCGVGGSGNNGTVPSYVVAVATLLCLMFLMLLTLPRLVG